MAASSNQFTSVTFFSKLLAFVLFIAFPFVGFYAGIKYQKAVTDLQVQTYSSSYAGQSGIMGRILVFHCNGRLALSDTLCWQTPYAGFAIIQKQGDKTLEKIQADGMGRFTVKLDPGTYIVSPSTDAPNLIAGSKRLVTVRKNEFSEVLIEYTINNF